MQNSNRIRAVGEKIAAILGGYRGSSERLNGLK